MNTYSVIVTRDVTESTVVYVHAKSVEDANEKALDIARDGPDIEWELDVGSCGTQDPYIGDPDGAEIVK